MRKLAHGIDVVMGAGSQGRHSTCCQKSVRLTSTSWITEQTGPAFGKSIQKCRSSFGTLGALLSIAKHIAQDVLSERVSSIQSGMENANGYSVSSSEQAVGGMTSMMPSRRCGLRGARAGGLARKWPATTVEADERGLRMQISG